MNTKKNCKKSCNRCKGGINNIYVRTPTFDTTKYIEAFVKKYIDNNQPTPNAWLIPSGNPWLTSSGGSWLLP